MVGTKRGDHRRNAKEAIVATAQATALPRSVDNVIYVGDGLAFVRVSENCLEVFEDTDDGLRRTIYFRKKKGKQAKPAKP